MEQVTNGQKIRGKVRSVQAAIGKHSGRESRCPMRYERGWEDSYLRGQSGKDSGI